MSLLISVEEADFIYLKNETQATSGNLSVQIEKLSEAGYIKTEKTFRGKISLTICRIMPAGIEAFREYVEALQEYLKFLNVSDF